MIDGQAAACPVCLSVVFGQECSCGWILSEEPLAGWATAAEQRRFEDELTAARRAHDVRAVLRVAPAYTAADTAVRARLARLVRGGPASPAEIEHVRPSLRTFDALTSASPGAALEPALRGLVEAGVGASLAVVDLAADGLRIAELVCGDGAVPHLRGGVRQHRWAELVPDLPEDRDRALFAMAGGIGEDVSVAPGADVRAAVDMLPRPGAVVLVNRLPGRWPVVARILRGHTRAGGSVGQEVVVGPTGPPLSARLVEELLSHAPLAAPYGLVGVEVEPDSGRTRPAVRTVFPAGTTARSAAPVLVPITLPAAGGRPVVLAVVGGTRPESPPVAVTTVVGAPGAAQVSLRLAKPGRVELAQDGQALADAAPARDWRQLLAEAPPTYRPRSYALDVAFAVELGGEPETVRRRLALVEETLQLLHDRHPERAAVRTAVVGYNDHVDAEVVFTDGLTDTGAALRHLTTLTPCAPSGQRYAPIEDALRALGRPVFGWRAWRPARKLVMVGSRAPHPVDRRSEYRCPVLIDWRAEIDRLRRNGLQRLAVWDPPAWCASGSRDALALRDAWADLAPDARLRMPAADARAVIDRIGALPPAVPGPPLLFPVFESRSRPARQKEEP